MCFHMILNLKKDSFPEKCILVGLPNDDPLCEYEVCTEFILFYLG